MKVTSDRRKKTDLKEIKEGLVKLRTLTGYTYERVDIDVKRQAGLIAQEVQKVLPEVVSEDEKGYLSMRSFQYAETDKTND